MDSGFVVGKRHIWPFLAWDTDEDKEEDDDEDRLMEYSYTRMRLVDTSKSGAVLIAWQKSVTIVRNNKL